MQSETDTTPQKTEAEKLATMSCKLYNNIEKQRKKQVKIYNVSISSKATTSIMNSKIGMK